MTPITGGMTNRNFASAPPAATTSSGSACPTRASSGSTATTSTTTRSSPPSAGVGAPVIARVRDPEALVVGFVEGVHADAGGLRRRPAGLGARRGRCAGSTRARRSRATSTWSRSRTATTDRGENGYPLPARLRALRRPRPADGRGPDAHRATRTAPCHNDLMPGNFIEIRRPRQPAVARRLRVLGQQRPLLRPRRRDQRARARRRRAGRAARHRVPRRRATRASWRAPGCGR